MESISLKEGLCCLIEIAFATALIRGFGLSSLGDARRRLSSRTLNLLGLRKHDS